MTVWRLSTHLTGSRKPTLTLERESESEWEFEMGYAYDVDAVSEADSEHSDAPLPPKKFTPYHPFFEEEINEKEVTHSRWCGFLVADW